MKKPLPDSKNYPPEQLAHYASQADDKTLQKVISTSKDMGLVEAARKELENRNGSKEDRGDYISFIGKDAFYREMYFKSYENQAEGLSPIQISVLKNYQENGEAINIELRNEDDYNYEQTIKKIDSCFDVFKIKHNIETMRTLTPGGKRSKIFEQLEEGDEFTDKSFCSTTINKGILSKFSESQNSLILNIRVPKGSRAIPMQSIKALQDNDYSEEEEILLPRDSKFKVISKKDNNITLQLL